MLDRKLIIQMTIPFISIITMSVAAASFVKFNPVLTPKEEMILTFSHDIRNITERTPLPVTGVLKSPIEIPVEAKKDFPQIPLDIVAPKPPEKAVEKMVSFILINGGKKMTIINGMVLKEGDTFDNNRVVSIEKDRVMIKEAGKEGKWVKMD